MKRALAVIVFVGVALVSGAATASADDAGSADLESYLDRAEESSYSGNELVVTVLDDVTVADIYEVNYAHGMMAIGEPGSMVGSGKAMTPDGSTSAEITNWSEGELSDRYSIRRIGAVSRLGRDAETVEVMEGDLMRARITFDDATSAPLTTEVFNGSGKLFRFATMLTFNDTPVPHASSAEPVADYDVLMPAAPGTLPAQVGGYRSVDSYTGPDDTTHVFYADGLFSFSVFVVDDEMTIPAEATEFSSGDAEYRRIVTPGEVWVFWRAGRSTHVLVGDLPPDHLGQVLADLPAPESNGLLKRFWRRLFG